MFDELEAARCRTLWLAVLQRAVMDASAGDASAVQFLDPTCPSFCAICEAAGVPPERAAAYLTHTMCITEEEKLRHRRDAAINRWRQRQHKGDRT